MRNCVERLVQAVGRSYLISPSALGELAADPEKIEDDTSPGYLVAAGSQMIKEVAGLQDTSGHPDEDSRTLTLQADLHFKSREARDAFTADLAKEVARLASRYPVTKATKGQRFRLLAGAYPIPAED